jgi:hypothetical protein
MHSENAFWVSIAYWVFGLIVTIPRMWKKNIPPHGLWLYLSLTGILTAVRTGLFIYLKLVVPYYEHNWLERIFSLPLYPEVMIFDHLIMHLMPHSAFPGYSLVVYPTFWIILISMLFIGSFMWFYPLLGLFSREKDGELELP